MKRFDAGLLNSYGGGSTIWWFEYIRKLLDDAHEHYEIEAENEKQELADILNRVHKEQIRDLTDQIEQHIMEEAGEDY